MYIVIFTKEVVYDNILRIYHGFNNHFKITIITIHYIDILYYLNWPSVVTYML